MSQMKELFSEVEEEYDELEDDWDIPDPEESEDVDDDSWAETWLDGIDAEDVDGYDSESGFWEV